MPTGSIYLLNVPLDRRQTLLQSSRGRFSGPQVAEPVPVFNHSRRAPLIVLASFEDEYITHISDGRKGASAGTDLVRLNMLSLERLSSPIPLKWVVESVPVRFRSRLAWITRVGGVLPPKTMMEVVTALSAIDPSLAGRLSRMSAQRAALIADMSTKAKENLALQKETLSAALTISGIGTNEVTEWAPDAVSAPKSYLDGLSETRVREDLMLDVDFLNLPGFAAIRDIPYFASRTFQADNDDRNRVTITMANRFPLEEQTGADLIYYNELYRSFVMVQYKAFEKPGDAHEFRWKDGDQFSSEISRMDALLAELAKIEPDADPDGFRFSDNPFFLKFCTRFVFNPDDKGLFPGIYLPLGLWKSLAASDRLKGERGGNVLTYQNVGRRMTNHEFVSLVAGSWVGTTITQSKTLEALIREVLEKGRSVTFAVKRSPPPEPQPIVEPLPVFEDGDDVEAEEFLEQLRH